MRKKIIKILIIFFGIYLLFNNGYNNLAGSYISCGGMRFPEPVTIITRIIVLLLKIVTPLGLIILGSLDFLKAVTANNEGDIKKKQGKFVKRLISAAILFFVITIVQLIVSLSADNSDGKDFSQCLDCMINDNTSCGGTMDAPDSSYPEQGDKYVPDSDFEQPELEDEGEDEE